jgi:PST family polysaccharide transporter
VEQLETNRELQSRANELNGYFGVEHLKTSLKTRALKGASITVVAQACNFGISTVGTIILARLLTPHDFGLVTMVLSISLLLGNFGANGFIEAIIQNEKVNSRQISTLFWINVGISIALMLLFMGAAPAIAWFYKEPLLKPIVVVMAISIFLPGLANQHQAILKRNMEFRKTCLIDVSSTIISVIIALYLATQGWGYWALVAKWIIGPLVITTGSWIMCRWRPGLPARDAGVRPMLGFANRTYGNFVASYFRRNLDKIFVGRFLGSQSLGNYDRAYQLSHMLLNQLISPLNSVALSAFSRVAGDPEKYRRHYLSVLSILAFICMPLSAVLTLIGRDLILLLFGPQWIISAGIFTAFGLSIGVEIIYQTHPWLHLSLGTPDRWLRWGIFEFVFTTLCFLCGIYFGGLGVALAFSISNYILLIPGLYYAARPVDIKISSIVSVIVKYFLAAAGAGLLCWFFLHVTFSAFLELNIILRIMLSTGLCISIYLALLTTVFRGRQSISEFVSIVRYTVAWNGAD